MFEKRNSEELFRRACEVLTGGVSRNMVYRKPFPNYAVKASGSFITDTEGAEYLDFSNNNGSLIHGHAHPAIVAAVYEQLQKGTAYTLASEIEVAFAHLMCNRVKGFEKIRFVNSGTEAVMAMIKASRAFTGRPKIAKAEGTYHGTYDFAEVSQVTGPSNRGSIDHPNSVPLVHGTPEGVLGNVIIFPFNDIGRTLAILDEQADQIACVMIDPVPHRIGLMHASDEFIEALYTWTRNHGALLVFDEVVTFRVGYGGAQERYSVTPDMTALGKIIGGGFPVGAIAGRNEVMRVFDPCETPLLFPHSGTFSANPITMTAGYVAMDLYNAEAVAKLNTLTADTIRRIEEVIRLTDVPVSITVAGSMFRFHLTPTPPASYREAYQPKEVTAVINELVDFLYFRERILMINTFACMFSTVMTTKETDRLCDGLHRAFTELKPLLLKSLTGLV